jgi:MFS family permease
VGQPDLPARAGRAPLAALFAANGLSLVGNAMAVVIVPLYVLSETGSALLTGLAGALATAPVIVGGALGGVAVDRLGFRRAAIIADVVSGITVLAIPALAATVGLPLWALFALVFLGGLFDTPGNTAKSALVPDLVVAANLPKAAAITSAISRSAMMIGAALAAVFLVWVGPLPAFVVDAVTFGISALLIAVFVHVERAGEREPESYWGDLTAGARFIASQPVIRNIMLLVVVTNLFDSAGVAVLKPVYASAFSSNGELFAVMVAVFAGGAFLGAASFGWVGRHLPRRALFVTCFVLAGPSTYFAMAIQLPVPALITVFAIAGLAAGSINPLISTLLYEEIPRELRARVLGALTTGVSLGMPLGSLLGGVAVATWGIGPTVLATGIAYLVVTLTPLIGRSWRGLTVSEGTKRSGPTGTPLA